MKALKNEYLIKTSPHYCSVETHIPAASESHVTDYEEQVSTFPCHEAKSW